MLSRIISSLVRKAIFAGIALAVLLAIGFFTADRKDYPGKKQFEQANHLIDTKSKGAAQGDSDSARAAAAEFSASMKQLQAAFFSGGSGKTFATGGEFLTYVKRTPDAVVVLCHVRSCAIKRTRKRARPCRRWPGSPRRKPPGKFRM